MTKFEQIGVAYQNKAYTKEYAVAAFQRSCDICCYRGIRIPGGCERCAIENCHKMTLAYFDEKED